MSKRDSLCFDMKVFKHITEDATGKEPVYKVILKPKSTQVLKAGLTSVSISSLTLTSDNDSIFELLPKDSERKISMIDEQTTLT